MNAFRLRSIQDFLASLSRAYWQMNYEQFLDKTGFVDSDYSLEKFKLFQRSVKGLLDFDVETLTSILAQERTINK